MKKESLTKGIQTQLPVFNGFYNTLFDINDFISENIVENINQNRLENDLHKIDSNQLLGFIEVDNNEYQTDVAIECCKVIETELKKLNLVSSIKFNNVISPKEYNYINDSIDCKIDLTEDNIINIKKYLDENINVFETYLYSKHSHRDGFNSNYPNNLKDWVNLTKNFTDFTDYDTLYIVLNFVCYNENIDDVYLYNEIEVYVNILNSDVLNTLEYDNVINKFIKIISNCGKSLIDMYNEFYQTQTTIFDKPDFNTWYKSNPNLYTFDYVNEFGESED
jgi:hypothetical protein